MQSFTHKLILLNVSRRDNGDRDYMLELYEGHWPDLVSMYNEDGYTITVTEVSSRIRMVSKRKIKCIKV